MGTDQLLERTDIKFLVASWHPLGKKDAGLLLRSLLASASVRSIRLIDSACKLSKSYRL